MHSSLYFDVINLSNLGLVGICSISTLNPFLDEIAIFFRSFAIPSEISMQDEANFEISIPKVTRGEGFTRYFLKYLWPSLLLANNNAALALPIVPETYILSPVFAPFL